MVKTQGNIAFWGFLTILMLATSIAVLLVDISIKAAILEESNHLRLDIEKERNGQAVRRTTVSDDDGTSGNRTDSADVLDIDAARLETGDDS